MHITRVESDKRLRSNLFWNITFPPLLSNLPWCRIYNENMQLIVLMAIINSIGCYNCHATLNFLDLCAHQDNTVRKITMGPENLLAQNLMQ